MAFNVTAAAVKKKREELDCSMLEAKLACEVEAASSIATRKYLIGDEYAEPPVTKEEMWQLFEWLIARR